MNQLKEFIANSRVLIVDKVPTSRAYTSQLVAELGADTQSIYHAKDATEARHFLKEFRPQILFCDDSIGYELVVELLRAHRDSGTGAGQIFFLLTGNTSQAAIGRAAEEEFDGFLLKPFTRTEFLRVFQFVATEKIFPSDYQKQLQTGRELLFKGEFDQAVEEFEKAKSLAESPATAHFYIGQAKMMKKALEEGKQQYKQGLSLNQIHCKCLVGMYDILIGQEKVEEAYEVLRRLVSLFPANPRRLSTALSMAVKTGNFRDVENYYEYFEANVERTADLVNHMCSALAVNGKYHLMRESPDEAIMSFERAVTHGEGKEKFVSYVIDTLTKYGYTAQAAEFVKRLHDAENEAGIEDTDTDQAA